MLESHGQVLLDQQLDELLLSADACAVLSEEIFVPQKLGRLEGNKQVDIDAGLQALQQGECIRIFFRYVSGRYLCLGVLVELVPDGLHRISHRESEEAPPAPTRHSLKEMNDEVKGT